MADETPEPAAAAPAEGGEAAAAAEGAAPPKKKGIKALLVIVLAVLLGSGAAVATVKLKAKFSGGGAAAKPDEHGEAPAAPAAGGHAAPAAGGHAAPKAETKAASGGHGAEAASGAVGIRNKELPVPLTSSLITFAPANPAKPGDADKIVTLDVKGEQGDIAQPQAIVRNIAGTSGASYVSVRIALVSSQEDFMRKLNLKGQFLIAASGDTLGRLTMKDLDVPGVQVIIRRQLLTEFNGILGPGTVQDVLFTSFAIQR